MWFLEKTIFGNFGCFRRDQFLKRNNLNKIHIYKFFDFFGGCNIKVGLFITYLKKISN